jgi:hypothetical protein
MTEPDKPQEQQVPVSVTWEGLDTVPAMASNVVMVQQTPYEFVLTFGFASPPIFTKLPTPEELARIKIQAQAVARLSMPPGRIVELVGLLQQQLAVYQQLQKQ